MLDAPEPEAGKPHSKAHRVRGEEPYHAIKNMIDVLFLLIIFFMVGTRFTENEHQIQLTLPKSSSPTSMVDRPGSKIVTMYADGTLELDGRRMDISQITAALIPAVQNYPDLKVQFRPDVGANIGQASQVMEAISRAGVRDLGWTTTASRMPSSSIR